MKINIQLFGKKARVVITDDKIQIQEYKYSWKKYVTNFTFRVTEKSQTPTVGLTDVFRWECFSAIYGKLNVRLNLDTAKWVKNGDLEGAIICFAHRDGFHQFNISKIS